MRPPVRCTVREQPQGRIDQATIVPTEQPAPVQMTNRIASNQLIGKTYRREFGRPKKSRRSRSDASVHTRRQGTRPVAGSVDTRLVPHPRRAFAAAAPAAFTAPKWCGHGSCAERAVKLPYQLLVGSGDGGWKGKWSIEVRTARRAGASLSRPSSGIEHRSDCRALAPATFRQPGSDFWLPSAVGSPYYPVEKCAGENEPCDVALWRRSKRKRTRRSR